MRLGTTEILLILSLALLVFGPSKLPQLGESVGRSIRNFRKAASNRLEDEPEAIVATAAVERRRPGQ
jgi:TatA/E family protein of Tat protein translocase